MRWLATLWNDDNLRGAERKALLTLVEITSVTESTFVLAKRAA